MNNEKSWLTCREAATILNFSQRHIINIINKGKLSAEKDEDGKYYIQKSEFYRVYPHLLSIETGGTGGNAIENINTKLLEEKIKHLQEIVTEKRQQNDYLKEQLSNFTNEKSKMLDAINSHSRLLEYKESIKQPEEISQSSENKNNKKFIWSKIFQKA